MNQVLIYVIMDKVKVIGSNVDTFQKIINYLLFYSFSGLLVKVISFLWIGGRYMK